MRTVFRNITLTALCAAGTISSFAGDQTFDFNVGGNPPSGDPGSVPGFVLMGTRAASLYQYSDGNPPDGGYLQLNEAVANQNFGIVFPDVDLYTNSLGEVISLPIKAFKIEADLRVGNGTRRPADGFSISFCRPTDIALTNALREPAVYTGWAGGDSVANANSTTASGNPETGTRTGLSVSFDANQGNWVRTQSNVPTNSASTNDKEGILVRLDDVTLTYVDMANRNGGCYITETNAADPCVTTSPAATNSLQTGPWSGASDSIGDSGASDLGYANLTWQKFSVELDANRRVTVKWKGATLVNQYQLTNYPTSQGRLLLAGRNGGRYEHVHIDNVRVVTTPSIQPVVQSIVGTTNGFDINIQNVGAAQVTNFASVILDTTNNVTSLTVRSNYLDVSTHGIYRQAMRFLPRSTHSVTVVYQDALGQRFTNSANFTVSHYVDLPASIALPLSAMDTTKPGFKVKSYQGWRIQPNQLRWTEEQVIGLRGLNIADQTGAVGGFFSWDGVPRFSNGAGGTLFPGAPTPWTTFGIGPTVGSAADATVEMFAYLYFPTNGTYVMYVGSDDGFRLSFSAHPQDRMGLVANEYDGGRGLAEPGDQFLVNVSEPGCYPVRMLWENGHGPDSSNGANLQWFTGEGLTANYALINDVANPASVLAYAEALPAASLGAYIKRANPVRDGQNVTFWQPIQVDLGDGTGSRTVKPDTIALAVDGNSQTFTISALEAGTTRILSQMGTNLWTVGRHTNLLTFADNAGYSYSYEWPFTVVNVQPTNTVTLPAANMAPVASVDTTKPGFRIKTWQSPHDNPNHLSWTEMQLQGLKGPNVADQAGTLGSGFFQWGQNNNGSEGDGVLDLRYSSSATASLGEYGYSVLLTDAFQSIGYNGWWTATGLEAFRFNVAANRCESSAMDIGAWLVFPAPGYYIIHANSDDGCKVLLPTGSPFGKLGLVLAEDNVGRGQGNSGAQIAGSYASIYVPAAGAYPFRIVYENGGTDGGIELSVYRTMPDGTVNKLPVNALNDPLSIKAYQTLTAGDVTAPYVSFANPPHNHQETAYWQPVVVELTDGPGNKTVNTATLTLTVDGVGRPVTVTKPSAGVTRVVQDIGAVGWLPGAHTAVLAFSDNSGSSYAYTWPFTVMNLTPYWNNNPGVTVDIPASSAVPLASVDHTKPGFRVYVYQSYTTDISSVQLAEEMFLGLRGTNFADMSAAVGKQYFVHNDVIDFADGYNHIPGATGYDTDAANGRYRYNYPFSLFGIKNKGGGYNSNDCALIFTGYAEFEKAGLYAITVNSDDGFKLTVPFGNPQAQVGTILGWAGTRGNYTGTGFGPQGNDSHCVFNIPAPGAYPIRLLYFNRSGGVNVEATIYQFLPNGSVARTIMGDTNTPGAIKVYQDSSASGPYVTSMNPGLPYNLAPDGLQVMTVDRGGDVTINLKDGNSALNPATLSLTIDGVAQPLDYVQPGAGVTTVVRRGTNALPSGLYAPAIFTYQDMAGRTYSMNWTYYSRAYNGTVWGGMPVGAGDESKRGLLMRVFQADTPGTTTLPTRAQVAEQLLAGVWTNNNVANLAGTVSGYFVRAGTDRTNSVINFNLASPANSGNFNNGNGYKDWLVPGIPGFGNPNQKTNSFAAEILSYVEFPTNGTYVMGVNSDDGFRVTRGWAASPNLGALVVNSPTDLAGVKATAMSSFASRLLTNAISGELALGLGTGNGSSNPLEGCFLTNAPSLAGKIALIYRGTCNERVKVQNAAAAGALAVVLVQDRPVVNAAEGWFPTTLDVTPIQDIPLVTIKRSDGDALAMALTNNTSVNVTLTPEELVNIPADSALLGQADYNKGAGDVLFNVTVPAAGVYPLRLVWFQGGGGGACEWFSYVGGSRVLINDGTATNGPALKAYYGLAMPPAVTLQANGNSVVVDYTGTLQQADKVNGPWTDVFGQPPLVMPVNQASSQFFRSR